MREIGRALLGSMPITHKDTMRDIDREVNHCQAEETKIADRQWVQDMLDKRKKMMEQMDSSSKLH